jgi:hypothetical protein
VIQCFMKMVYQVTLLSVLAVSQWKFS